MNKIDKIMLIMNQINYGFIDDNGINIFYDDSNVESVFSDVYHLMSPEELLTKKYGVCWDQVELERKLFADINMNFKTYFISIDDKKHLLSHTFLVYKDNNMYYWFEHSWHKEKGIHEYDSINKLLKDVKDKFVKSHKKELIKEYKTYIYEYKQPNYNITCAELYDFIFKQRKVYNYKLSDVSKNEAHEEKTVD